MVDPNGGPQWWFWASFSNETGFSSSWLSWALSKVPVAQSKKSKKSKKRPKRCVCCVCRKTHIHTYVNIQRKHTDLPWLPRYWFRYVTPSLMVVLSFRFEWCFWASYHVHARYMCYPLPNGGLGFRVDSFELPFLNSLVIGSVCVCVTCVCYWSYPLPNGGFKIPDAGDIDSDMLPPP